MEVGDNKGVEKKIQRTEETQKDVKLKHVSSENVSTQLQEEAKEMLGATPVKLEIKISNVEEGSNVKEDQEMDVSPIDGDDSLLTTPDKSSRRGSGALSDPNKFMRRKSLAQNDLMAVFYLPNTLKQPIVTDVPFESKELEGLSEVEAENKYAGGLPSWEPTLERAIKSIVSIKCNSVRSFDTEQSGSYTATGFVIDAKNGIILSNRHVVNPAPTVSQAVFVNYEEVELLPVYRDPIHDFGFFKFDPEKVKFMELSEIKLAPSKAKVGMEIRVVGNDAGEKLSILSGTLARLDRNAPDYGVGEYNDFNTFYIQAASGTSGGSSGSPVLDIYGDAVALNAGGSSKASSSYYLPLKRVVRAFEFIKKGMAVPRGTLQTEFEHLPYDELRRLGLSLDIEKGMRERYPDDTGMLVVKNVTPEGPAEKRLASGDIVVAVNDNPITNFDQINSVLDDSVDKKVELTVWRGHKAYKVVCKVQDLHQITPSRFVEVGGGVVNELSYQLARSYGLPVRGVHVASSGHMLGSACAWRDSIILSVNHIPTPNLDAFAEAISSLTSGTRVPIKYFSIDKIHKEKIMIMNVTCQWHPFRMATRDPNTGLWSYKDLNKPLTSETFESNTVKYPNLGANLTPANLLWPSFVSVDFYVPYLVDGMVNTQHYGPGYIIDKKHGLVLCDRDTVPISAGDVYLTFAQSLVITAKIVFLHPVYNFTVLQYNPELLGETDVEELKFSPEYYNGTKKLIQGDEAILVGVGSDHNPFVRRTLVSSRGMLSTNESSPPRWRVSNVEGIKLDDQPSCQGGVISDENGLVKSFWVNVSNSDSKGNNTSFMAGLDVSIIRPVVEGLKHGHKLELRSLDAEFWTIKPAAARSLGMSGERLKQMSDRCVDNYSKFYYVLGLMNRQSHASKLLNVGDVVLEVNGNLVTDITDLAVFYNLPHVDLTILREQEEIHLRVPTSELPTFETTRIISWAGAIVQQPYRAVQEQLQELPSMVYVTCTLFGSPANSYGLKPGVWITELEGERIKTLDDLTAFIKNINAKMRQKSHTSTTNVGGNVNPPEQSSLESSDSGEYVRMTVVNKLGVSKVLSLKLDEHYWPSMQILNVDSQWKVDFDVFNDNFTS